MVSGSKTKWYSACAVLAALCLLPLAIKDDRHLMHLLILCFMYAVVAAAWDLIMGYARVLSYAQMAFLALGAYTTAMLTLHLNSSPWLGMLAGGAVATVIGLAIGLVSFRLRGIYVGMATLALHIVLPTLIRATRPWGTGGSYGLTDVPSVTVGGYMFSNLYLVPWYYLALGIFVIFISIIYFIIRSTYGLAFVALRDSEAFAKSLGIHHFRFLLTVFAISAFVTGVMGAVYTHYIGVVSPSILGLDMFLLIYIMVMVGGLGRFPGAIIGAFVVVFLNDSLIVLKEFRLVILGSLVVAVMILLRGGLMGIGEHLVRLVGRRVFRGSRQQEH